MRRFSPEGDAEHQGLGPRTWAGRAYTDEELDRRFGGGAGGPSSEPSILMDENAARRMVEAERAQTGTAHAVPPAPAAPRERSRSRSRSRSAARLGGGGCLESPAREAAPIQEAWPIQEAGGPVSLAPGDTLPASEGPGAGLRAPGDGLRAGGWARLTGLRAAAQLNGQMGRLEAFDHETGRWHVQLGDGEEKAIKPENLLAEAAPEKDGIDWIPPQSPDEKPPAASSSAPPMVIPKSPPPSQRPSLGGSSHGQGQGPFDPFREGSGPQVAGLSSASLAGFPPSVQASARRSSGSGRQTVARRLGTVRWYNGRRKLGHIIPDGGGDDLFIPAQGAANGSQVPPQPGGLFHGTRVSYTPMTLKRDESERAGPAAIFGNSKPSSPEVVCMDVRPLSGQVGLTVGVETTAGAKEKNDDRLCAVDLHELGFFCGVFDGHRGSTCAEYVAKQLPTAVHSAYRTRAKREGNLVQCSHDQEAAMIASALTDGFEAVDRSFLVTARKKEWLDGSTGIACLVSHGFEVPLTPNLGNLGCAALWPKPKEPPAPEKRPGTVPHALGGVAKLFIAWAGDCRAVLLRGRTGLRISEDHRPQRPDEKKRIQKAGGTVIQDRRGVWRVGPRADNKLARELEKKKKLDDAQMKWFLSTSRGFGDSELKVPDPVVTATPEVKVVDLVPEDWAAVVGSDGIFDVLSDQKVADCVWRAVVGQAKDPVKAAKDVVQLAMRLGSRDNLTVIVLRFGWAAPPAGEGAAAPAAAEASDSVNIFGSS